MLHSFSNFINTEHTLTEFNSLPKYKKYLLSLSKSKVEKLAKQGLDKEALNKEIIECLTNEETFKDVEQNLRKYAIELGYDDSDNGLDEYQHCHPLVLAASYGRIDYLRIAASHDFTWHHPERITYTMGKETGNNLNRSERYEMLEIAAKKKLYDIIDPIYGYYPWSGMPNNYKNEPAGKEINALKSLISASLDRFSAKEELLAKYTDDTKFQEVCKKDPIFRELYNNKIKELSETESTVAPLRVTEKKDSNTEKDYKDNENHNTTLSTVLEDDDEKCVSTTPLNISTIEVATGTTISSVGNDSNSYANTEQLSIAVPEQMNVKPDIPPAQHTPQSDLVLGSSSSSTEQQLITIQHDQPLLAAASHPTATDNVDHHNPAAVTLAGEENSSNYSCMWKCDVM